MHQQARLGQPLVPLRSSALLQQSNEQKAEQLRQQRALFCAAGALAFVVAWAVVSYWTGCANPFDHYTEPNEPHLCQSSGDPDFDVVSGCRLDDGRNATAGTACQVTDRMNKSPTADGTCNAQGDCMCTDHKADWIDGLTTAVWLMLYGAVLAGACCVLVGGTLMIQCIKQRRQQRKPLLLPVVAATPV